MNKRKFFISLMALMLVAGLAGCQSDDKEPQVGGETNVNYQFVEPQGPTAVIETSMGNITVAFFPEQAPKAVENFLTHARNGYFDGMIFHRVINDFMIQGGSKDGTGSGGESIWGVPFEDEFSDQLHNFPGALSMANSGTDTNGSQFFIVQSKTPYTAANMENMALQWYVNILQRGIYEAGMAGKTQDELDAMVDEGNAILQDIQANGFTDELLERFGPAMEKYQEIGGTPHLDYKHTVFGQVISGMDVVDAIAAVSTDSGDRPVKEVTIIKVTVIE